MINTNGTIFQPFLIEIDEFVNVINSRISAQRGIIVLDATPTSRESCALPDLKLEQFSNFLIKV